MFDPKGNEIGMYNDTGWFNKHGHEGAPENIPSEVERQIRGQGINEMRRRGTAPAKGKANIKGVPICKIPGLKALEVLGWLGAALDLYDMVKQYNEQNKHDAEMAKECGVKPGFECM